MLNPPDSDKLIYFNVPDMLLFTPAYFETLTQSLEKIPDAHTVRFVVSSVSRQVKHIKHNPPIDDTNCNVCVIDVSTTPDVTHRHGNVLTYSLAERITEVFYTRLKESLHLH